MNIVEVAVRILWKTSLAWKRVPGYVEGQTVSTVLGSLQPLYTTPRAPAVQQQAEALSQLIVRGKIRRKKLPKAETKVIRIDFVNKPAKAAPSIIRSTSKTKAA